MKKQFILLIVVLVSACTVNKSTKSMHPYEGDVVGCGDFIVYKLTEDNEEYISIVVDLSSIVLEERQAYAIGKADVVNVTRKKFNGPIHAALCNDVMGERPEEVLTESADGGIVELIVGKLQQEKKEKGEPYTITLVLKNVTFETATVDYLRLDDVNVGWLPG